MSYEVEPPRWRGPATGRRVLIEEPDPELRLELARTLEEAGFRTAECEGPGGDGGGRCPLVEGPGCHAAEEAEAVLQVPVSGELSMGAVRRAIREHAPDLPIAVMVPAPVAADDPDLVAGSVVTTGPLTRSRVVAAVRDALGLG